jgi:hypothetical protein
LVLAAIYDYRLTRTTRLLTRWFVPSAEGGLPLAVGRAEILVSRAGVGRKAAATPENQDTDAPTVGQPAAR